MPSLGDLVNTIRLIIDYVPRAFWKAFVQPILTVAVFLIVAFSILAIRTGGASIALNEIFVASHSPDQMQVDLHRIARQDELIKGILTDVLKQSPTAARIRLGVIHNGEYGLAGASLLRYDITHAKARDGYSPGPITSNSPLANWSYINDMIADRCTADGPNSWTSAERAILAEMGADFRLVCPVIDPRGRLLGALYMTWSGGPHANIAEIDALSLFMRERGRQIAVAIEAGSNN